MDIREKVKTVTIVALAMGLMVALHTPAILLLVFTIALFAIGMQEIKKDEQDAIKKMKNKKNNIEKR